MIGVEQAIAAGYAAFKAGDLATARQALAGQTHPQAIHLLGLVEKSAGNYSEARTLLTHAAQLAPDNPEVFNNLGLLERLAGNLTAAEGAFRAALSLKPDFRSARLSLVRTLHGLERDHEALAEGARLLAADPDDVDALVAMVHAAIGDSDWDRANGFAARASALRPQSAFVRHASAAVALHLGQLVEAEAALRALLADGHDHAETWFLLARTLEEAGDLDAAMTTAEEALTRHPSKDLLLFLADLHWMRGETERFDACLQSAMANPDLALTAIGALRKAGHLDRAYSALSAQPDHIEMSPAGLSLRSALFLDAGDASAALQAARDACRTGQDVTDNLHLLRALLAVGEAAEALELIEMARRRDPLSQFWLAYEATALRMLGDPRYTDLIDYEHHIRAYDLSVPDGYASIEAFDADLLRTIERLHPFEAHPLNQSLRGGAQSPRNLTTLQDPVLLAYFNALRASIEAYMATIGTGPGHPTSARNTGAFRFAGCWSVRLKGGGYHVNHIHPKGWISSAYYVSVPPETGTTEAREGWISLESRR
ncbi:MAG: tetratricopeptide repeat protein [Pseudomonadota bacterium]